MDEPLISNIEEESHALVVSDDKKGMRLDAFLAAHHTDFSRTRFKDLIKAGQVTVNGVEEKSPNHRLSVGDQVICVLPEPEDPVPKGEDIPLAIVYEDEHLIVVDKSADMVVHPAVGNWTGTLVNALIHHCGDSLSGVGGVRRPGIVHRLDKETSGLMVIAKNDKAHKGLAAQFADHGRTGPLKREYKALLWHNPPQPLGTVQTEIGRSNNNRVKMAVVKQGGREAITHYKVLEMFGPKDGEARLASLVACRLETGRTHQIRVHMTHLGCPLVGDPVYGTGFATKVSTFRDDVRKTVSKFKRQALHAYLLSFEHPVSGEAMAFESELPGDLERLCDAFRVL